MNICGVETAVRDMAQKDRGFVVATWKNSYREHALVGDAVYDAEQPKVIDRLLGGRASVMVVCSARVPDTIFAWACGEGAGVLHWVYVVPEARKKGLARQLVELVAGLGNVTITHRSPLRKQGLVFNPYLIGVVP